MIRLIATDLDGTLLQPGGVLSDRTRATLNAVGADVVIVTARPPRFVRDLGLAGTAICANGAIVYDLTTKEVTHARTLPFDVVRKVCEALAEVIPNVGMAVETGLEVLCEPAFRGFGPNNPHRTLELLDHVFDEAHQVVQMLAWAPDAESDHMMEIAREAVGQHVTVTHSGGLGLLEISPPGISKAVTLETLCTARGIAKEEVIAFGDMPNDLSVLGWAGTAYAMGNAHPLVKQACTNHAPPNTEDGVAQVLESLFRL
ncbi:Cof-type HAD-IIB family hydrolase [Lentzea sp.]|uniref:Cof-type HAD-IIB family hydrolase n=1 Tax=Lentzea sp. TaxID=56099 RepID=UPI002C57FECD|nr:Cof-type HAD-IIB family hydrolase [Lentzea sp.]HUQ57530.1 Cof-type HAD-IIB family hydrolase [Lentzea sp.]